MSKSFRDLVEAINKKAKDDLALGSKHRVKAMAKFVAAHDVQSDYPADRDDGKTISILNAKKTAPDSAKHDNAVAGERKIVRQGTSKVVEDVSSMLTKIAHSGKSSMVTFADGDTANVDSKSAKKLLNIQTNLNSANGKKFKESINKNAAGLLKMMNFSAGVKGDK